MLGDAQFGEFLIHAEEHKDSAQSLREGTDEDDGADQRQDEHDGNHIEQEGLSIEQGVIEGVQRDDVLDGDDGADCRGDAHADQQRHVEEERLDDVHSREESEVAEDEHSCSLGRSEVVLSGEGHANHCVVVHDLDDVLQSSEDALDDAEAQPQDRVAAVLIDHGLDNLDDCDHHRGKCYGPDGRLEVPLEGGSQHRRLAAAEVPVVPLGNRRSDQEHHAVVEEIREEHI